MGVAKKMPDSERADTAETLICHSCGEAKPPDAFYPHKTNARGRQYWCMDCHRIKRRERAKIPQDPRLTRKYSLWSAYRITPEQYDAMYERQKGQCLICKDGKEPWAPGGIKARNRFLVVDHDHSTGDVRGLLCQQCNFGIGQFREDPVIMFAAAGYLGWDPEPAKNGRLF